MRRLLPIVMAAILALTVTAPALAKGGHKPGGPAGTVGGIVVPDGVFAGTTTALVTTGSGWAHASCSQGGMVVYQEFQTVTAGQAVFHLGPTPTWGSGPATCTADARTWSAAEKWVIDATTKFAVSG